MQEQPERMRAERAGALSDRPATDDRRSIVVGSMWMVAISVLLFWLPLVNGFVGGLVGGYKVKGVKRALAAAVLPVIIVTLALWLILAALELPVVGLVAGLAVGGIVLLSDIGLFLGAALGGAVGRQERATV